MREPRWFRWARVVVLTLLALFALAPVYVMLTASLKPLPDVEGAFRWIPSHLTFSPFVQMWQTIPLLTYLENSLIVCSVAAVASVLVALFASYAVSRYRFHGRQVFTITILSTQMFPGILFLLPLFVIFVNIGNTTGLNLYGTRTGLIITYMTFTLPFAIWMLAAYLDTIPRELDEAAAVDGTGPLGAFIRVVIPAAVPGIVAVLIYAFMTAWSEMLFASVLTNDSTRTLAVGLQGYATQNQVYWNQIMAASLTTSVPIVVGFLLLQRFLVGRPDGRLGQVGPRPGQPGPGAAACAVSWSRMGASRRSSSRCAVASWSSRSAPSAVSRTRVIRPSPSSPQRSTSPAASARSISSTVLCGRSSRYSARSPTAGGSVPGWPLMASSSWCWAGVRPTSRARASDQRRKRRSPVRNASKFS